MKPVITIDESRSELIFSSVCTYCRHFDAEKSYAQASGVRVCKAFPQGIPAVIWNGENTHIAPFPGDKGIVFSKISPDEIKDE